MEEKMVASIMTPIYAIASNVTSSMGMDTDAHWKAVSQGRIGISRYEDESFSNTAFWASKIDPAQWQRIHLATRASTVLLPFEQLAVYSASQALDTCELQLDPDKTLLILSTTKGNIEWMDQLPDEQLMLHHSASVIGANLGIRSRPVVVSHACVSGVVALLYALRTMQAGRYRNAIVIGCDRLTKFVLNGFQSFQAIADEPCKPFDAARKGINLGEAASTIILSAGNQEQPLARLLSGATSNDANHISGPSRTGQELSFAIDNALSQAGLSAKDIDMVSAHGTATLYNDEMEANAFSLSGLDSVAVHSFKGYTGHTLGAAGILESAMVLESMKYQQLIPSAGYSTSGVTLPLNITREMQPAEINYTLKTASGFGGCNAALIWGRVGE
jgi:3-oxoacyl-[acyl-carrier-protein] synthase-1